MADSYKEENNIIMKKRSRDHEIELDDSEVESKKARVVDSGELFGVDSGVNSPAAKRIEDDLLSVLDDSDTVPTIQGLESVMKSFEEEILVPASDSGRSPADFGFLLEASDNDLGLPPSFSSGDEENNKCPTSVDGESGTIGSLEGVMFGFEDEIPSYDHSNLKFVDDSAVESNNIDYNNYNSDDIHVLGDSLFDYPDESFETAGFSDSSWQHESLSALW